MYTDVETLYRETLARNPDAWLAHDNLGNILFQVPGDRAEAIAHFQAAIRAHPDYWEAHQHGKRVRLKCRAGWT